MSLATTRRGVLLGLASTLAAPLVSSEAWAAEPVDMLLVLAADVSRSVTEPKFRLQREGMAAALANPEVVKAMTSGPNRRARSISRCSSSRARPSPRSAA